jgi:uncharacterized membrane protein
MKTLRSRLWPLAGIVFIVVAVPFILQLVPPNRVSGFRVERTLSDERVWYAANRVMGYDLLAAGAVILVTTIVTARLLRGREAKAGRLNLLVFIASLMAALAHSFWALGRL